MFWVIFRYFCGDRGTQLLPPLVRQPNSIEPLASTSATARPVRLFQLARLTPTRPPCRLVPPEAPPAKPLVPGGKEAHQKPVPVQSWQKEAHQRLLRARKETNIDKP